MKFIWTSFLILSFASPAFAILTGSSTPKIPNIEGSGVQGSVGAGFTDFTITSPAANFKIDRGTYAAAQIEHGFGTTPLYFTMTFSQMNATGNANYKYTDLGKSTTYTATNLGFRAQVLDLSLGFKWKIIDNYWFRPYIEAGGVGSYDQITYDDSSTLTAQGTAWKKTDVIMGSGGYAEGGIEVSFTDKFGVKFAAKYTDQQTKDLETQNNEKLQFKAETYYFSALMNF